MYYCYYYAQLSIEIFVQYFVHIFVEYTAKLDVTKYENIKQAPITQAQRANKMYNPYIPR